MNGDEIRRLREALGMTQAEFAAEVGVDACSVSRWERGKTKAHRLAVEKMRQLAQKAGAPVP